MQYSTSEISRYQKREEKRKEMNPARKKGGENRRALARFVVWGRRKKEGSIGLREGESGIGALILCRDFSCATAAEERTRRRVVVVSLVQSPRVLSMLLMKCDSLDQRRTVL